MFRVKAVEEGPVFLVLVECSPEATDWFCQKWGEAEDMENVGRDSMQYSLSATPLECGNLVELVHIYLYLPHQELCSMD